LACHIVIKATSPIAHEVSHDQGHLDGVASQSRLIAADDDIAARRFRQQLPETAPGQKVVAGPAIVHVFDLWNGAKFHPLNQFATSVRLDIQAELLFALVIL